MKSQNLSHLVHASRESPHQGSLSASGSAEQPLPARPAQWATRYIAVLKQGHSVRFQPVGHSMTGRVNHKDVVEVRPLEDSEVPRTNDVVLCTVGIKQYLHLVKAIRGKGEFLIGNNRGGINGWVPRERLHGTLVSVNPSDAPAVGCVVF